MSKKAKRLYKSFHKAPPPKRKRRVSVRELKEGDTLVKLGILEAIVYKPTKPSRKGLVAYEHEFGDYGDGKKRRSKRPILAATEDGKHLFIVKGASKYHIAGRGIVG